VEAHRGWAAADRVRESDDVIAMMVSVGLPGFLRQFAEGQSTLEIDSQAPNVAGLLEIIGARYPGVTERVLTERGEVREHVNIFVDGESIRVTGGLFTPLAARAEVLIVPAVSGG
jgi:sulfur-carrier protein